jgi:ABC-type nitrate/sulfonate/bicarbonate transport system permease component
MTIARRSLPAGGGPPMRRPMPRTWPRRLLVLGLRLGVLAALLGTWEWAGRTMGSKFTFPPASDVAAAFVRLAGDPEVWQAALVTLEAFVFGFSLALVVGIALGMITARFVVANRLSAVWLRILMTAPLAPLVPLLIGLFGIGLASRVALVFLFSVAVIALNTQNGIQRVDRSLLQMATSFGVNEMLAFRRVRLPGAVPAIMAGVRLGAGRAVVGMVVAELIIVSVGLGRLINVYRGRFQAADMFAVVIVILIIGVAILLTVKWLERRMTAWKG